MIGNPLELKTLVFKLMNNLLQLPALFPENKSENMNCLLFFLSPAAFPWLILTPIFYIIFIMITGDLTRF